MLSTTIKKCLFESLSSNTVLLYIKALTGFVLFSLILFLQKNGTHSFGKLKTSTRCENAFRSYSTADMVRRTSPFAFWFCLGLSVVYRVEFRMVSLPPQANCSCSVDDSLRIYGCWWIGVSALVWSCFPQWYVRHLFNHSILLGGTAQGEENSADNKFTSWNICVVFLLFWKYSKDPSSYSTCSVLLL